jgi:hypothetical protein
MKVLYRLFRQGSRVTGNYQIGTVNEAGEWLSFVAGSWRLTEKKAALKRLENIMNEDNEAGVDAHIYPGTGSLPQRGQG